LALIARELSPTLRTSAPAAYRRWRARVNPAEESHMQWQIPKLVEIACGCEINAYFPADL
jgi:coenzyme PQQ precursor peptide PqqA